MADRTVLVLGASSDLAIEALHGLPFIDATVLAHYHSDASRLEQLSLPHTVVPIKADLADSGEVTAMIERIAVNHAPPDAILHFAAPKLSLHRFHQTQWSDFARELGVQVESICRVLQAFIPQMAKNRYGKVVFVLSSAVSGKPPKNMPHYVTAKYALLGLMKCLAAEYADKQLNINAVSPSMVDTKFLVDVPGKLAELAAYNHPLKRNAEPRDIAPMVNFLLSDAAAYITGENIAVTGGA
jgi:3-oxoacyl-[acyl-carrier protein] reductase